MFNVTATKDPFSKFLKFQPQRDEVKKQSLVILTHAIFLSKFSPVNNRLALQMSETVLGQFRKKKPICPSAYNISRAIWYPEVQQLQFLCKEIPSTGTATQ